MCLRAKVDLKRAGPRVTSGAGKTGDAEAERAVGRVEGHRRLKGIGVGKTRAVMLNGAFEQQGGQRIVVIVFEAAPILRAAFFEGIADAVDAILQIIIVFQKSPVEEREMREGEAQDVVRGFCPAFRNLQQDGVGDGGAYGIAGGIPAGVGGHRVNRRFGFEQQRQQRMNAMAEKDKKAGRLYIAGWFCVILSAALTFLSTRSIFVLVIKTAIVFGSVMLLNYADTYKNGYSTRFITAVSSGLGVAFCFMTATSAYTIMGYGARSASRTWVIFGIMLAAFFVLMFAAKNKGKKADQETRF